MSGHHQYRLAIDAFTPETLPMARLAEYIAELARLLGAQECVQFRQIEPGSVVLVASVDNAAVQQVAERLLLVRDGVAPREAMQGYRALDTLLAKDDATATLLDDDATAVIVFPGRARRRPRRYGPFREHGSLDGCVIRIGGRGETIPVLIADADGVEHLCQAGVEMSKHLAQFYRGAVLRLFGSGRWLRDAHGAWLLQQFDISHFEVLDEAPLGDVVARLRALGGDWHSDLALRDAEGLRGEGTPH